MSEPRRPDPAVPTQDVAAAKRTWHAPKLEEVDYTEAQSGAGIPTGADFTTYLS
jgi:hypothetical protein